MESFKQFKLPILENMKRTVSILASFLLALVAFAYDFTGRTFSGEEIVNGRKVTVTYHFKSNGRLTGAYKVAGQGSNSDNGMLWEVSGDYINYYDSTGDYGYLMIDEEEGEPILIMFDSQHNPCLTLREVKGAPQKSKSRRTVRKK